MLEDLKERQRGFRPKEKARLYVTVAACLILGVAVYGGRGCDEYVERRPPVVKTTNERSVPKSIPFDLGPLEAFRKACPDPSVFDAPALEHVTSQIIGGKLPREPEFRLAGPADVAALDCKEAAGKLIEFVGTVKSLDRENWKPDKRLGIDLLWSFALESQDGKRVVVVHPGFSAGSDEGKPYDAYHPSVAPTPLQNGDRVRVRAIYLQQRIGSIGAVTLDGPTAVLVGKEYRRAAPAAPPLASLDRADWAGVKDRRVEDTRLLDAHLDSVEDDPEASRTVHENAYYQILSWIRSKGHDQIVKELKDGTIPVENWGSGRFQHWREELEKDDGKGADPRSDTNAYRGKAFVTTGLLADFLKEDWDTVTDNAFDFGEVWRLWTISHHYGNAPLPFDGAFPRETYKNIYTPVDGPNRQRVRAYGIFYKNYSFIPSGAEDPARRAGRLGEITVPGFLLLHVEPDTPVRMPPLLENPFFWISASLLAFGAVFFFLMSRIEKKEAGAMRDQSLRIKRRHRATDSARAGGAEGAGGTGAGGGAAAVEPPDPAAGSPP